MPSTPRCHEIPHSSIHACRETNWKPGSAASNSTSSHTLSAAVKTLASSPTSLTSSGRRRPTRATASEPATGARISTVRMGKLGAVH